MPPHPSPEQRRFFAALRAGEDWAWRATFDGHYPSLYRFFRSRVPTDQVAEDLASDVFLEAFRSIGSFAWIGAPFGAWLFGIARHVLASHYRSTPHVEFVDASEIELGSARPEFLAVEVRDTLERLDPDHRVALELRYLVGLTGEEAAAAMGRSHGAFRSLLHRAALAFRRESETPELPGVRAAGGEPRGGA